jgi:asparagine synthase (glutamine-hydrolysing)
MCGIVGLLSKEPVEHPEMLLAMRDTLRHRGPDDCGSWWSADGCAGLGHTRLAIIDLSPGGRQPMADISGRLRIIFNGEIYNYRDLKQDLEARGHRFATASDTEVILEAYREWGVGCLARLNGMFAFGLYDTENRKLFLARDRAGEKPLFYHVSPTGLVFASELKALMADPGFRRELDIEGFEHYLAYGYVPEEKCILAGVHKLPQGHAAIYDIGAGRFESWAYWRLPESEPDLKTSAEDLEAELEVLLADSVKRQLVADVPVGILLSGGMDSSLVTAMAARASARPVRTFTVTFPGHFGHDEGLFAKLVAEHFGAEHTELEGQPATVEVLPKLARQFDEPIADSAIVPTYLISQMIRKSATVALSGDGGDELFGGYPHYSWILLEEFLKSLMPGPIRRGGAALGRALPLGFRGRNRLRGLGVELPMRIAYVNLYFDEMARRRLVRRDILESNRAATSPESYRAGLCGSGHSPLGMASRADFRTTLVDAYLVKVDRASMLASLEIRAPMLDHRIIEFAFGRVPDALRATRSQRKVLLRRLARRLLPPALDLKRKQGFTMPLASWFRGPWGPYMESVLREADSTLFDHKAILKVLEGQRNGYPNEQRLFALTMFELWRREYRVSLPA